MNNIENIHCFLFPHALYNNHRDGKTSLLPLNVIETKRESMIMTQTFTAIRRITSVPALASAILALYGVALITHSVAGIAIV